MFSLFKFLAAAGIATFGIWYMFQYDSINEVTGGVAFVCVIAAFLLLKWDPDFGPKDFIVKYKHLKWKPGEFTRHWLITGDTGVGKTTSGFNPLLHQISVARPNWGGLILGAKGDEHFFALEHFTALGAHTLFDERDLMKDAHPNVRAMYAWHAIEEVEHKGVAYDVMIDYAHVGYAKRVLALIHATFMFPYVIHRFMNQMLKHDGFTLTERIQLKVKGYWWLLKPGGFVTPIIRHYLPYYKPGYHPWQEVDQPGYEEWLAGFNRQRDPIEASESMRAAMVR